MKDNYLSHHGILGQRWGVRRYQNPDGTLTEAGKKRYVKDVVSIKDSKGTKKEQELRKTISERAYRAGEAKQLKAISDKAYALNKEHDVEFKKWLTKNPGYTFNEYDSDEGYGYDKSLNKFYKDRPDMKKKWDKVYSLYSDYRKETKKYFNNLLGEYAQTPLKDVYGTPYPVYEFYATKTDDYFFDRVYRD